MKAEDLMVGDWVTFNDCEPNEIVPIKIAALGTSELYAHIDNDEVCDVIGYHELTGIPLTPEILKKNGFEKLDFSHYHIKDRTLVLDADGKWEGPLSWHWVVTEMGTNHKGQPIVLDYYVTTINYVHELQHALRLCGIDKEIIL